MKTVEEIYKFALKISSYANNKCLEFQHTQDDQTRKNDHSWVTQADKQIEQELRQLILSKYPSHNIVGEEEGGKLDPQKINWIIDPIDGTFSFVHNIPFYSCLLAVFDGDIPIVGIANLPGLGITISSYKSGGVFINQKKYERPALVGHKNIEIVATSDVYRFEQERKKELIQKLYSKPFKARTYGDGLAYYLLLIGSVRIFVDPKVEIWDVAPFHVIMKEAGFAIHSWEKGEHISKGTSVCYPLDNHGKPLNCSDVLELIGEKSFGSKT